MPLGTSLETLCERVAVCERCPRMEERSAVLGRQNGNLDADVVFVAEAPGRLGADRTRVPLSGDRTGYNFEAFLEHTGWKRADVFVTNAVLCNPRDQAGNNSAPRLHEINNCASFLREQIDLVDPKIVVSLGAIALRALSMIFPHSLTLKENVGQPVDWYDRKLVPLYHPGPRALLHRPAEVQKADYVALAAFVRNSVLTADSSLRSE